MPEWDLVASQIFGASEPEAPAEEPEQTAPVQSAPAEPVIEDIVPPVIEGIAPPVLDEIKTPEAPAEPVIEEIAPPVLDEIKVPETPAEPVIEDIAPPVIEDLVPPQLEDIPAPAEIPSVPEAAAVPEPPKAPVLTDNIEDIVVPDMSSYNSGFNQNIPQQPVYQQPVTPVQPVYQQPAAPVQPVYQQPVAPVQPVYQQPAAPATAPEAESIEGDENNMNKYRYSTPVFADEIKNPAPVQAAPVSEEQPQIIMVPQFAGYDANGQPIYNYVQMKMAGRDANGQPIFAPIQGQGIPAAPPQAPAAQANPVPQAAPVQPVQPAPVQTAPVQAQAAPIQNPAGYKAPTANVSKIAVNPHPKATSQAFITAISNAKSYSDKSLLDTQGLQKNAPLFDSIEDVLSQMGDNSVKAKRQQAAAQKDVQVSEYKAPARSSSSSAVKKTAVEQDERFMTKAELKAKKKQDKIDAQFKKDLAKRGF